MKPFLLLMVACAVAFAADETPPAPTYKSSPVKRVFKTGLVKPRELKAGPVDQTYRLQANKLPGKFHLSERAELSGIFDQGNCGSCVYNAVTKMVQDQYRLNGVVLPELSRQYTMDCSAEWSCNGSYAALVAGGMVKKGGTATAASYPYRARDQACAGTNALYGKIKNPRTIDRSAKSIMSALFDNHPVTVTVAANSSWMNYASGIYNGCNSTATNHQVLIYGWDCETSVDAEGYCVFNDKGYPVNGDGYAIVPNSWGYSWGDQGEMKTRWLGKNGKFCNNIAEEATIVDLDGVTPTPTPTPTPIPKVDGGWSQWSAWSVCTNGYRDSSRTCTNPAPSGGGANCVGASLKTEPCKEACSGFLCGIACWLPWCER